MSTDGNADEPKQDETPARSQAPDPSCIVGVGASAGGLEALEALFRAMPVDTGMAFVVLQHLSPDFESKMDELLARQTPIRILAIEDGVSIEPNTIYLAPARNEMIVSGGRFVLSEREPKSGPLLPIDAFLRSLAQELGPNAVGIVLSGTGSDGSRGIREIHDAGGLVLAQEPDSARFDGMPRSAIETGTVDAVLTPEDMPEVLVSYATHERKPVRTEASGEPAPKGIDKILKLLHSAYGIDFAHYKPNTVMRRVGRRLSLGTSMDIDDYAEQLAARPEELNALYRDLLIGVTKFFRDHEAFRTLEALIGEQVLPNRQENAELRLWVPGCATGEEAYSLAIVIDEQLRALDRKMTVKIFATDVHPSSLEIASAGIYPEEALAEVTAERRARYFRAEGEGRYRVSKALREHIVFARHNVISDAPFTRLDLISCRNLLIYFKPPAQKKALSLFHFALRTEGLLVLGPSETPGPLSDEFDTIDAHWKIFSKRRDIRLPIETRLPLNPARAMSASTPGPTSGGRRFPDGRLMRLYDQLLDRFMPPGMLLDERGDLLHSFGDLDGILRLPRGRPSTHVLDLVHPDLRTALSGAIQSARKDHKAVSYRGIDIENEGEITRYRLSVEPIANARSKTTDFLVLIDPINDVEAAEEPVESFTDAEVDAKRLSRDYIGSLESELRFTKENLQATIEELETSNEELQATNEELVASNEELQSTNEELHSVNEELYTVNAEHQKQIEDLRELTDDMDNLLQSIDVGVLFLDTDLRIRKFTKSIASIFHIQPQDAGRRFDDFAHNIEHDNLVDEVQGVLDSGRPVEREVHTHDGDILLLRVLPYRAGQRTAGVVLTLIDIGYLKRSEANVQRLSAIVESSADAIHSKDLEGTVLSWNKGAERLYGYTAEEMVGQNISRIVPHDQGDAFEERMERLARGESIEPFETQRLRKDGHPIFVSISLSAVRDARGRVVGASAIARDVTRRRRAEEQVRNAVRQRDQFLAMLSHELRNPLMGMAAASDLLTSGDLSPKVQHRTVDVIRRQTEQMARILDDLLDVSRLQRDNIEMRKEVLDLRQTVEGALDAVRSRAEIAGVDIETDIDGEPIWVEADPARMQQLIVNLLGNAIKYSPKNTTVRLAMHQADDERVSLTVEDEGVGIPEEMQETIFEAFQQGSDPPLRDDGRGLGLGLTLVRSIAVAHGGAASVHSDGRGQGSRFSVSLPVAREAQRDEAIPPTPPSRRHILLVEDQQDNRELLEISLTQAGFRVSAAEDGRSAIAAYDAEPPDFAIVDIGLPDMTGLDVARHIRSQSLNGTKLIALTGHGMQKDRQAMFEAGFDEHLVKPVSLSLLHRVLTESAEHHAEPERASMPGD